MTKTFSPEEQNLLCSIHSILLEKGIKATTMDLIARKIGISKRTLYEIFENKTAMIKEVMTYHSQIHVERINTVIEKAPNIMVALLEIFDMHRKDMTSMNVNFFKDMDRLYPELRDNYDDRHEIHRQKLISLFNKGVEQGVFRDDINFSIMVRIMEIQGEAIKRMEELFPPEITLLEIYDTITMGFLRSLASAKGNKLLNEYLSENKI